MFRTKFSIKKVLFLVLIGRTVRLLQSVQDNPFDCLRIQSSCAYFSPVGRDVQPALSLSFKLKLATFDQHSAGCKISQMMNSPISEL